MADRESPYGGLSLPEIWERLKNLNNRLVNQANEYMETQSVGAGNPRAYSQRPSATTTPSRSPSPSRMMAAHDQFPNRLMAAHGPTIGQEFEATQPSPGPAPGPSDRDRFIDEFLAPQGGQGPMAPGAPQVYEYTSKPAHYGGITGQRYGAERRAIVVPGRDEYRGDAFHRDVGNYYRMTGANALAQARERLNAAPEPVEPKILDFTDPETGVTQPGVLRIGTDGQFYGQIIQRLEDEKNKNTMR